MLAALAVNVIQPRHFVADFIPELFLHSYLSPLFTTTSENPACDTKPERQPRLNRRAEPPETTARSARTAPRLPLRPRKQYPRHSARLHSEGSRHDAQSRLDRLCFREWQPAWKWS